MILLYNFYFLRSTEKGYFFDIVKKKFYNGSMVKEGERVEDLVCRGYRIIQDPKGYCFTSDSVLLANLARVKKGDRVVDLCTGSGVVALLMRAKYDPKEVIGVELQPRLADMATRSVALNEVDNVKILCADVKGVHHTIGYGFDVVTVNPPYGTGKTIPSPTEEDLCKEEIAVTAGEVIKEAAILLRFGGLFYMVNKSERLTDVLAAMRTCGIEPKTLRFIQPKKDKKPDTFVVEGKRGARPGVCIPTPLVVYDDNGEYTEEMRRLYEQ